MNQMPNDRLGGGDSLLDEPDVHTVVGGEERLPKAVADVVAT
jgi:hypothetical protein